MGSQQSHIIYKSKHGDALVETIEVTQPDGLSKSPHLIQASTIADTAVTALLMDAYVEKDGLDDKKEQVHSVWFFVASRVSPPVIPSSHQCHCTVQG